MANIRAQASGNWSATSTWQGGVLPGPNDIAIANSFTVTIDQDINVQRLANSTFGTSTSGGFFQITTVGAGLTRNVIMSLGLGDTGPTGTYIGTTGGLLRISATSGTVDMGSTNIRGGFNSSYTAVVVNGAGIIFRTTGDVFGGANSNAFGIQVNANNVNLYVGDVIVTGVGAGVTVTSGVQGCNIYAQDVNANLEFSGSATGINHAGSLGSVNVKNIYGSISSNQGSAVVINISTVTLLVDGEAVAGISPAFTSPVAGSFYFRGPLVHSEFGVSPIRALNWNFLPSSPDTSYIVYSSEYGKLTDSEITLTTGHAGPYPTESDVRSSVLYSSSLIGLLEMPLTSEVSYGVPVDYSEGEKYLTQGEISSTEVAPGVPLYSKLLNSSTISTTGDQIMALGSE